MIAVLFITKHVRRVGADRVNLIMPYIPNARQDRVKSENDVFTLKYFAEFINNLNFDKVVVFDPHSSVSEALINNIIVESPKPYIEMVIENVKKEICNENLIAFYPDEGAMKRYSGMLDTPYTFGIKMRNWETGKIEGLDIAGACGLPKNLVDKTPTDGLCGKTDEDNLGFTYSVLDKYIRTGICNDIDIKKKIDERHNASLFKLTGMARYYHNTLI